MTSQAKQSRWRSGRLVNAIARTGNKHARTWFLIAAASGTMLNPLNSSMISLALHRIQTEFQLSFTTVSWLISSFYLSSAVVQPVLGKIGDHFGRKKVFLLGLLIVAASSFGALLSTTFILLLVMRLFLSVGSSSIYPSALSMVREHIKDNQASALAAISVVTSAAAALGPTIGGALIDWGDWPAIFTVNFPIVFISICLGWFFLPADPRHEKEPFAAILSKLDLPGILLFAFGMSFFLWFLLSLDTAIHPLSGILGLVFFAGFLWRELHTDTPFIDIRLFRTNAALSLVFIQFIILNIFNYTLFFGLPSYFQDELHYSVTLSGLLMLFLSGFSVVISPITGKWIDRTGVIHPLLTGGFCMLIGAVLFTLFFSRGSIPASATA